MTVSLRIPGWITDGTVKVPADTVQAMAELVGTVRDQAQRISVLEPRDVALRALLKGIAAGMDSDVFRDAYREALLVVQT